MEIKVLLTDGYDNYNAGNANPFVGTEWECPGWVYKVCINGIIYEEDGQEGWTDEIIRSLVIKAVNGEMGPETAIEIHVYWKNDTENVYVPGDLTITEDLLNNCKSIWKIGGLS